MGDTADGSWGSRELGGFIRREEARKAYENGDTGNLPRGGSSGPVPDGTPVDAPQNSKEEQ